MAKTSKISGADSSATASPASPTSKGESFVVSDRLTPLEIESLKLFSKRVNAVSLHGSKTVKSSNGGGVRTTFIMPEDQLFVERRDQGDYAIRRGGSARASAVAPTQAEAIARAKQLNPDRAPLVERVRNTDIGQRDKWRKAYQRRKGAPAIELQHERYDLQQHPRCGPFIEQLEHSSHQPRARPVDPRRQPAWLRSWQGTPPDQQLDIARQ
jgi:hypothetical protein